MKKRFTAFWARCGGADGEAVWQRLDGLYGAADRHYHGWPHIADCLRQLDRCGGGPPALELALWFHDAVYDPRAKDNEEQSAQLLREYAAGMNADLLEAAEHLIRVTQRHLPEAADEALICDIDLSILGSSAESYEAYVRRVRAEYAWVPEAEWICGRGKVLQSFLDRAAIYRTEFFANLESAARANLARELAGLERAAAGGGGRASLSANPRSEGVD